MQLRGPNRQQGAQQNFWIPAPLRLHFNHWVGVRVGVGIAGRELGINGQEECKTF